MEKKCFEKSFQAGEACVLGQNIPHGTASKSINNPRWAVIIEQLLMKRPYIIAEIGVNHNGNFDLAKKTIRAAQKVEQMLSSFKCFMQKSLCQTQMKFINIKPQKVKKRRHV